MKNITDYLEKEQVDRVLEYRKNLYR
jgi:hypothetical protein